MRKGSWWDKFTKQVRKHHPRRDDGSICLKIYIWLRINDTAIMLRPNQRTYVMSQLHTDQIVTLSLQAVDSQGNIVDATFENTQWSNSNEAAAASKVSDDGLTDTLTPGSGAIGQATTVSVSTQIGGVTFTASITETIVAGAVAGVQLIETFSPKPAPTPAPTPAPAPAATA